MIDTNNLKKPVSFEKNRLIPDLNLKIETIFPNNSIAETKKLKYKCFLVIFRESWC